MVTPGQLEETVAQMLGFSRNTVHYYAQQLRTAGLFSTGGRGMHAVNVTEEDAINLLIAMCGADSAKSAPGIVKLTRDAPRGPLRKRFGEPDNKLSSLDAMTVGDLLRGLLADDRAGRLNSLIVDVLFHVGDLRVEVIVGKPDRDNSFVYEWRAELEFFYVLQPGAPLPVRYRDPEGERSIDCVRHTINRINKTAFSIINAALAEAQPA